MPIPKAQLKALIDELSKIGDKAVSKHLNNLVFRPSDDEVAMLHPELQPPPEMPVEGQPQDPAMAGPQAPGGP